MRRCGASMGRRMKPRSPSAWPISSSSACSAELVKLRDWVAHTKQKVVILFEGPRRRRPGGAIKRITQRLNPRVCRVVALPAPNDRERTQWYFQRYVPHLPAGGEMVPLRPQLVQPRRRRARDGLLRRGRREEFFRSAPGVRTHAGALRHQRSSSTGSRSATNEQRMRPRSMRRPAEAMEALTHGPESGRRWEDYTPRQESMLERTTSPRRPGGWCRPTTRTRAVSTASSTCWTSSRTTRSSATRSRCLRASGGTI